MFPILIASTPLLAKPVINEFAGKLYGGTRWGKYRYSGMRM